ncbi:MAG: hypothetical protein ABW328_02110 [Ilumatobacteraceae bacterium]
MPDELGHGACLLNLLDALGLPPAEPRLDEPWLHRATGWSAGRSPGVHHMVSMAYHSIGAINERLALEAYGSMAAVAVEIGEDDLARALSRRSGATSRPISGTPAQRRVTRGSGCRPRSWLSCGC